MGYSAASPNGSYRLQDHQRYLDAWLDAVGVKDNVIFVLHDWGSALGFNWTQRHAARVKALVYMESIVRPFYSWADWPDNTKAFFQAQRSPAGEEIILQKNLFIEYILPLRGVPKDAIDVYRRYWSIPGPSRVPMLAWTRELPIEGEPKDVVEVVEPYGRWLSTSPIPKLFNDADPAGFLIKGSARILPLLAEPAAGDGKRRAFLNGGLPERGRRCHRQVRAEGPRRTDQARGSHS
jgi:haloalkane dehalogenase